MDIKDFLLEEFEDNLEVEKVLKLRGKPKQMKFKPITAELGDEIRRKSRNTTIHKGQKIVNTNEEKFLSNMIIETTIVPDLKNAELQKAWGVMGAEDLLSAMKTKMLDGEFAKWADAVSEVNGYSQESMDELVTEAKN